MANISTNTQEGEMQITVTPSNPFDIVHTDHFGPLTELNEGFKHIPVLIDAFTRFTWFFAVKSTTTKEIIKHFFVLFHNFGNPNLLISDRRTAFTSQEFTEFLQNRNIRHRLIAVATSQANSLIERVNKFLKSSLRKIVEDNSNWKSWTQYNML